MSEQEVYFRLIDWLKQHWLPLPDTDKLIPIVKAAFTPEEASLLIGIPFSGRNLEELAEIKQMDPAELRQRLDALAKKGAIFRTVEGNTINYSIKGANFILNRANFWSGRADERTKTMAPLANQYYPHFFDVYKHTHHKVLRALPIEGTIEDTRQILPYEEVAKVLDIKEYFCVATCACRHRKNLTPDLPSCKYSTENCLHFDRLAHYIVENDLGREITREEAHEILRKSAEEGLVHGLDNYQKGAETICNCCQCCCVFFQAYHKLGHTEGMVPSNYRVRPNPELCIGCGLCIKRCPMNALHLEGSAEAKNRITKVTDEKGKAKELKNKTGQVVVLEPKRCIGCGVCAYKCSTQSLVLERRKVITHPPKDGRQYVDLVVADLEAAGARGKSGKQHC